MLLQTWLAWVILASELALWFLLCMTYSRGALVALGVSGVVFMLVSRIAGFGPQGRWTMERVGLRAVRPGIQALVSAAGCGGGLCGDGEQLSARGGGIRVAGFGGERGIGGRISRFFRYVGV